jgi:hypothetical protein
MKFSINVVGRRQKIPLESTTNSLSPPKLMNIDIYYDTISCLIHHIFAISKILLRPLHRQNLIFKLLLNANQFIFVKIFNDKSLKTPEKKSASGQNISSSLLRHHVSKSPLKILLST